MNHSEERAGYFITTVKQARRLIKIVFGFTILMGGLIMLVTPGPGVATIVGGLAVLATEYVWAKKLMQRVKDEAVNAKNSLFNNHDRKNRRADKDT